MSLYHQTSLSPGTCQITRNSNEMCMGYNALARGSTVPYTTRTSLILPNPDGWRSWLVLQNPAASPANLDIGDKVAGGRRIILRRADYSRSRRGMPSGPEIWLAQIVPAQSSSTSDLPVIGTCQITRNSNKMCMSYTASDHGLDYSLLSAISPILPTQMAGDPGWSCKTPLKLPPS